MITVYDKLLSSLFNFTDNFLLTILFIALINSLITKIIEVFFKDKTKFISDFNKYIKSKEFELKNKISDKVDFRKSLYEIHEKYNYSPFYSLIEIVPFLIQIPFLLSVYFSILKFEKFQDLRFLFISDLSSPDGFFNGFNLLPFAMLIINLIILKIEKNKISLKDLLFPFLFLILLYEMPSALIIYWTFSLILTFTLPNIVFNKKIYSFYTIILAPYFLIKLESINNFLNILFFFSLIFLFDNLVKNKIKKLKHIMIPIIFSGFYVWFFQDLSILILSELNIEFNNQPVANLWRIHYSFFLIIFLSFLISLFSNKSIKTVFTIWILVLLILSKSNSAESNIDLPKEQVSLNQKSQSNSLILIILDEYSSPSELKNFLNKKDLNHFTNYLLKNNWFVKENFKSAEISTALSMFSIFNYNLTGSEILNQRAKSELYTNFLDKKEYVNSLLLKDLRKENIKMESYGLFDFNLKRNDEFLTQYAADEVGVFLYLNTFSKHLSFMNNNVFFFDIFSKSILERINNRYKIEAFRLSIFDYFKKEIIDKYDFVYYHFDMPHGPFRFKNEFNYNGNSTNQYAKFWKFTNQKFEKYLSELNLENDKVIIVGDHGYRSNIKISPYNTFGAFYGFDEKDVNEIKTVQDIGLLIKKYLTSH